MLLFPHLSFAGIEWHHLSPTQGEILVASSHLSYIVIEITPLTEQLFFPHFS